MLCAETVMSHKRKVPHSKSSSTAWKDESLAMVKSSVFCKERKCKIPIGVSADLYQQESEERKNGRKA